MKPKLARIYVLMQNMLDLTMNSSIPSCVEKEGFVGDVATFDCVTTNTPVLVENQLDF